MWLRASLDIVILLSIGEYIRERTFTVCRLKKSKLDLCLFIQLQVRNHLLVIYWSLKTTWVLHIWTIDTLILANILWSSWDRMLLSCWYASPINRTLWYLESTSTFQESLMTSTSCPFSFVNYYTAIILNVLLYSLCH